MIRISNDSLWAKLYAILIALALVGLTTISGSLNFSLLQGGLCIRCFEIKVDERRNRVCQSSMTQYALFDLHLYFITFGVMNRSWNV